MTTQFNCLSYLDVAEHLLRQRPLGEEFHRSAVNRAYFGIFCHIRDTLQERGASFSIGRDVHRQVLDALQNDPRPEVIELGKELDKLRRERNRADYRSTLHFVVSRSRSAVSRARGIREALPLPYPEGSSG